MNKLNIRKKLIILIIIMLVPMFVVQIIRTISEYNKSIELELNSNKDFAEAVGVTFTNYLERVWSTELAIGLAITSDKTLPPEKISLYLEMIKKNQGTIKEYSWVNKNLIITASSNHKAIGVSLRDREYINRILKGEDKVVSDLTISRVDNERILVVSHAIRNNNEVEGIINAVIDVEKLGSVLPADRVSAESSFGLIDRNGIFIYRSGVPGIAQLMIPAGEGSPGDTALKGEVVKTLKYKSQITGKTFMGIDIPIKQIGWDAYANVSYNEVMFRIFYNIGRDFIILLMITFVCLIFAIKISNRILLPIDVLQKAAQEISSGNLEISTNIPGNDELAAAGKAFDQMVLSIKEYDKLKTQFFSNLSHELKTPLNIILASVQIVSKIHTEKCSCDSYKNVLKYNDMVKQNCFRLLRLINNLIDITRIDTGFLKYKFGNYNIVSIVEEITLSITKYSEIKGIKIIFDTQIEEKIIACDPDIIERIMLNLLSNAIKFTNSGGSIYVNIFDRDDIVVITVKDTGIGIPEDKLVMVFERFRQVDSSLQRQYEGSGIGLSLVKALVEAHSGKIYVESEFTQGTEFFIELPVRVLPDTDAEVHERQDIDKIQKINIEFSDIYS